jgi:hypothetical protein
MRHRILDLAPPELKKLTGKIENFHELNFAGFREEVKKAFRADIPVKERAGWQVYIAENGAEVRRLTVALLEASLAGQ